MADNSSAQLTLGVVTIAAIIALLIYIFFPHVASQGPDTPFFPQPQIPPFPNLPNIPVPSLPSLPSIPVGTPTLPSLPSFPSLPSSPSLPSLPSLPTSGSTPSTTPSSSTSGSTLPSSVVPAGPPSTTTGQTVPTGTTSRAALGSCPIQCQTQSDCMSYGLACVEGYCTCKRSFGGRCSKPSDCDCRTTRCDMAAQKCVPKNFYYDEPDAKEMCDDGYRLGYFFDPLEISIDSTAGRYQGGYRCL